MKLSALLYGILALSCCAFFGILAAGYVAEDETITLERNLPLKRSYSSLQQDFNQYENWLHWIKAAKAIEKLDSSGIPMPAAGEPHVGDKIRILIVPDKKEWKRFTIELQVLEFDLNHHLKLKLLSDSTQKLTRLLQDLQWEVNILNEKIIQGFCKAKTQSARSRILAMLASRILLNQVFYVDLIKLAEGPTEPKSGLLP